MSNIYAKVVVLGALHHVPGDRTRHPRSTSRHWPTASRIDGELGRNLCDHIFMGHLETGACRNSDLASLRHQTTLLTPLVCWMPRWQNLKSPHEEKFIRGYYPLQGEAAEKFLNITDTLKDSVLLFKKDINVKSTRLTVVRNRYDASAE